MAKSVPVKKALKLQVEWVSELYDWSALLCSLPAESLLFAWLAMVEQVPVEPF